MNFSQAIGLGLRRYGSFRGCATRPEFWYWQVFSTLVAVASVLATLIPSVIIYYNSTHPGSTVTSVIVAVVFLNLSLLVPGMAVGARRLHDTNMSGWWQLVICVPAVGWLAWLVLMTQPSTSSPNRYDGEKFGK